MKTPENAKDLEEEVLDSSRNETLNSSKNESGYRNKDYDNLFEPPNDYKSIVYDGE